MKLTCRILFLWCGLLLPHHHGLIIVMAEHKTDSAFQAARNLWFNLTRGMPSNYTFEYLEQSSKSSDVNAATSRENSLAVDVRLDVVTNVYPTNNLPMVIIGEDNSNSNNNNNNDSDGGLNPADFPTVPDMFDMIQEAWAIALIEPIVQYDDKYGYPTSISILYNSTSFIEITVAALTPYTLLGNELDEQEALWDSYFDYDGDGDGEGEGTYYSYGIQVLCFCLVDYVSPKFIQVENNTIVSTIDIETGEPADESFVYETIPQLFQRIQRSIDQFDITILVEYDETMGYPTSISTNPEYGIADAGISISVGNVSTMMMAPPLDDWFDDDMIMTNSTNNNNGTTDDRQLQETITSTTTASPTTAPLYDKGALQQELDTAKALWDSHSISSYKLGFTRKCYCTEDYRQPTLVIVDDNNEVVVMSVKNRETLEELTDANVVQDAFTVDSLYQTIQEALDNDAYEVEVRCDETYGFVSYFRIDSSSAIADEERTVFVDYLLPVSEWQAQTVAAQELWQSSFDWQHYSFTFQQDCYSCGSETNGVLESNQVQVLNGKLYSINGEVVVLDAAAAEGEDTTTTASSSSSSSRSLLAPINELLSSILLLISDAVDNDNENNIYMIQVEYDANYGYPTSLFIDFDEYLKDEEIQLTISNVVETPPETVQELLMGSSSTGTTDSSSSSTTGESSSSASAMSSRGPRGLLLIVPFGLIVALLTANQQLG